MTRLAAGVAIAFCLLIVPVLSGGRGAAPRPVPAANCTGPVPPGAEINRCNALRARSELSRP
jgi:hypothetical protein